jgi:small-conductance mechanosensitive channel
VCDQPSPRVRFREFGGSGLVFELLAWIDEPVYRGRVLHELNGKVYKAFNAAGIEIPYSKHDVYIKEALPGTSSS